MSSNYLGKIFRYGLYLPLFVPIVFTSFTFFPWNFGKTIIFEVVVEILLGLFFLLRCNKVGCLAHHNGVDVA